MLQVADVLYDTMKKLPMGIKKVFCGPQGLKVQVTKDQIYYCTREDDFVLLPGVPTSMSLKEQVTRGIINYPDVIGIIGTALSRADGVCEEQF